MLIEHARPCAKPWGPSNKQNKHNHSFPVCYSLVERDKQKAKQVKIKNVLYNVMAKKQKEKNDGRSMPTAKLPHPARTIRSR